MLLSGRILLPALRPKRENPYEIHLSQRALSGRISGHLRKTAARRRSEEGIAPRHFLPTAAEIAEGIGRPMHVRKGQKPMPGIASAVRRVPDALLRQQHPDHDARRPGTSSALATGSRNDPAAFHAQNQTALRFRGDRQEARRQRPIRLPRRPRRGALSLQLRADSHRHGMSGHSFPHCAVRRRLSDENMRPVYARGRQDPRTDTRRRMARALLVRRRRTA